MSLVANLVRAGPSPERLFILIHGKGADEHDLEPLVAHLDPAGRFLFVLPRAPLSLPPGFQWYETEGLPKGGPQFVASVDALDDLLEAACAEHGLARPDAVVGGFSQGAALALALGLRAGERARPAALLAMSGFLPEPAGLTYDFAGAPPVLVQHGTSDPLIHVGFGRGAAGALSDAGVPVVYREYPMGHQVALESVTDAAAWLGAVLAGERPAEPVPDESPAAEPADGELVPSVDTVSDESPAAEPADGELVPSVDTAGFEREVLQSDLPVIVDFWAPWCQPCLTVAPVVEQIALMRADSYRVVKVNIDEEPALARSFGIQSIPLVALFRNGRMERTSVGAKPRPALEADLGMLVIP